MSRFTEALQAVAATLWVGALWVTGPVVAPLLFSMLPDRAMAGSIAGRLFLTTAWIGIGCSACLLLCFLLRDRAAAFRRPLLWIVVAMLLLTLAGEFGVQPLMAALREQALPQQIMDSALRERFAVWHGVASGLYVINCLLGGALVVMNALNGKESKMTR